MEWLTRADVIVLSIAAYVAVITLVRLMKRRHDEVVADVKQQLAAHQKRSKKSATSQQGQDRAA